MSVIHDAVHGWLQAWGAFLGSTIVLAIAIAALGLLAARFSRRFSGRSRHFLLSLALAAPAAGLLLIPTRIADAIRSFATRPDGTSAAAEGLVTIDGLEFASLSSGGWSAEWACVALAIWSVGVLALALWRALEWARWRTLARAGESLLHPRTRAAWESACTRGGSGTEVSVSAACAAPMVVGILRPAIVVPAGYGSGMVFEEMESVFLHELAHVARRDNFTSAAAELIGAIFWFDPVHWLARRRLLELREAACDEAVLGRGCAAEPYVNALAKTCRAAVSPAVACMADLRIRERMESIMRYRDISPRWISEATVRAVGIAALALAGLGIALFAPAESLADPGAQHRMGLGTRPGPDGVLYLDGEVRAPNGELVMAPRTTAIPGQPVIMTTQKGDRLYRLTVTVAADGGGLAKLEVLDGDELVDSVLQTFSAMSEKFRQPAEKITLRLVDADLHDFARALSQLTGIEVLVAGGMQGKVTVDVSDMPWPEAVAKALDPLGARMVIRGDEILFLPAPTPPAGYERVGPGITPPRIITRVDPVFPPEAREARIQGIVIVQALIGKDGLVQEAKALKGLPFGLDQAAVDAVRQWTFKPALRDGEAVPVVFNVTINFKLSDEDPPADQALLRIQADRSETRPDGTVRLEGNVRISVDRDGNGAVIRAEEAEIQPAPAPKAQ